MKTLFTITLLVGLIFGLGFVIFPGMMLSINGITDNPAANALTRNSGTALLGFVVLLWYARKSTNPEVHKTALATMFGYWLFSSITMIISQISGVFSMAGWGTVALHLGFLIVFGIFVLRIDKA